MSRLVKDARNVVLHAIADAIAHLMNSRVYLEPDIAQEIPAKVVQEQAELEQMICKLEKAREALS